MKSNFSTKLLGKFYLKVCKKGLKEKGISKQTIKDIKDEYNMVIERAKDIGKAQLLSSYLMGGYFIAMNRKSGLTADENYEILLNGLMSSKLFHKIMGNSKSYFNPKRTEKRKIWANKSHLKKYENDWVVDILDGNDQYDLGYDYTQCGICKLFKDEGCFELAHYMCQMDYPMADMIGIKLKRTKTLANGDNVCDFRYSKLDK